MPRRRSLPTVAVIFVGGALCSPGVNAHDAGTGWYYPPSCCDGNGAIGDCQVIPANSVTEAPDGFAVVLFPGDHHLVTRKQSFRIPYGSEIRSGDGNYHICLYPTQATVFCFFAPPGSV